MGFLGRIFGGKTFEEELTEANKLFAAKDFGHAKHAYDRALEKAAGMSPEEKAVAATQIAVATKQLAATGDALAEARLVEAERYIADREWEFAISELEGAMEMAASDDVRQRAKERIRSLERQDAVTQAAETVEITAEQRLAGASGAWESEQADEYERYGNDFGDAIVDVLVAAEELSARPAPADGEEAAPVPPQLTAALSYFEKYTSRADAKYLWLELGRARLVAGDKDGGAAALKTFLSKLDLDEGGEGRLSAHMELANLADARGDTAAALAELEAAAAALDEDPRPYLALGQYLRRKGSPTEAIEILDAAVGVMGESRPEWRVLEELGLAHKDAGNNGEAFRYLEQVVKMMMPTARSYSQVKNGSRDGGLASAIDLPPNTGLALADLYEKDGRLERAADMYRTLASGSDRANHARYHVEAARCLKSLDLPQEAERMLTRALALTESAPEAHAQVRKLLDELHATGA